VRDPPAPVRGAGSAGPTRTAGTAGPIRATGSAPSFATWPNPIGPRAFERWIGVRARGVPVSFDPRYATAVVVGDDEDPETGTLLMARVGKGRIIYNALTLDQQPRRGLVNLLSAGLAAGRCSSAPTVGVDEIRRAAPDLSAHPEKLLPSET
jgi:hypothetical protein